MTGYEESRYESQERITQVTNCCQTQFPFSCCVAVWGAGFGIFNVHEKPKTIVRPCGRALAEYVVVSRSDLPIYGHHGTPTSGRTASPYLFDGRKLGSDLKVDNHHQLMFDLHKPGSGLSSHFALDLFVAFF